MERDASNGSTRSSGEKPARRRWSAHYERGKDEPKGFRFGTTGMKKEREKLRYGGKENKAGQGENERVSSFVAKKERETRFDVLL